MVVLAIFLGIHISVDQLKLQFRELTACFVLDCCEHERRVAALNDALDWRIGEVMRGNLFLEFQDCLNRLQRVVYH